MKISISPKTSTQEVNRPIEAKRQEKTASVNPTDDYFAGIFGEDDSSTQNSGEIDPLLEHVAFYSGVNASPDDFINIKVPSCSEVVSDARTQGINIDKEFYTRLQKKYKDLKSDIKKSIIELKNKMNESPELSDIYAEVIIRRTNAISEIEGELDKLDKMISVLEEEYAQELKNMEEYGKEYYKWQIAYKTGEMYNGAKATLKNKPNPLEFEPPLDINGDAFIGDPDIAKLVIGTKNVSEKRPGGGEDKFEINDIVSLETKKAVTFSQDGKMVGVETCKDKDFYWTIAQDNLKLKGVDGNQISLELASMDKTCDANGLTQAAIGIYIPEYIRIDDATGNVVGIGENNGKIAQSKADSDRGWTLKRVIKVRVETVKSEVSRTGYDYLIKLYGDEDSHTPIAIIRVTGTESLSASKRSLALLAAKEDNPKYRRMRGLIIDAKNMKTEADFSIMESAWNNIRREYGATSVEEETKFRNASRNFLDNGKKIGIIVEGFNNIGMEGTNGNDLILMDEALEDNAHDYKGTGLNGAEIMPPEYTSSFDGRGGFNAVFHKRGNFVGNSMGFFWGGSNDDTLLFNVSKDQKVYINTLNETGHTEIGNQYDDPEWNGFGVNDDYYGIRSADYAFASWYEPEVKKYRQEAGIPPPPTGDNAATRVNTEDFANVAIADIADIRRRTTTQIIELEKALKEETLEETDEIISDYSGVLPKGEYERTINEMDNFFNGWNQTVGWSSDADMAAFDRRTR